MSELASFHQFLESKLKDFGSDASPEEVLDLWRSMHPSDLALDRDVRAVQDAIEQMKSGDKGLPLSEFDAAFRSTHFGK